MSQLPSFVIISCLQHRVNNQKHKHPLERLRYSVYRIPVYRPRKPQPLLPSAKRFHRQLLSWYDLHKRDLPWRVDHDPYRVWLSEIMLQQTRVAAVIEHYHEFLRRFPSVQTLAAARESNVLAAWSGLGYYRRARMLHAAAKVVVRDHGGKFPTMMDGLLALPGIGRYTAAAIASIAFAEAVAVVDGNVERVLQRISGRRMENREIWEAASSLLDSDRPGDFNQAMMELGAVVCTPRAPSCLVCPVMRLCATRGELPVTTNPSPQQKREIHYALHLREAKILLSQRSRTASLMAGMWELPELENINSKSAPLFRLRHSITVTDYTVKVWPANNSHTIAGKWISVDRLHRVALTGLARKILRKASIL